MKKVIIKNAKLGNTEIMGYAVDFELQYIENKENFLKDITKQCNFRITFAFFVLTRWQLTDDLNEEKIIKLAFPFVIEAIRNRIKDNTLEEYEEQLVEMKDGWINYPFDIEKIEKIEGYEIIEDNDDQTISLRIEQNKLANEIIVLRDNINVLFHSKTKDNLLKLGQERNILYLFRKVDSEEVLTYAIATLANLATDLNKSILLQLTETKDNEIKTINLLESFLKKISSGSEYEETIKTLRIINRLRQAFPIHTDKAGIVNTLADLNIQYPNFDYDNTWRLLLEKYRNALKQLIENIKEYAP
jgi:hypothetical protein